MKVIFFLKPFKFYVTFKNAIKLPNNVFGLEDNYGSTCCRNFSQLRQEYLWSAVNMLRNGPKIWDSNKSNDTQLNVFDINGKLA